MGEKGDFDQAIYFNYNDVISENGYKFFLKKLYEYGFVVVQNCKTEMRSVEKLQKKLVM